MHIRSIQPIVISILLFAGLNLIAQTGPGGVGTNDGSSTLELWLKGDQGLNCSTDGCIITSWSDQSGNAQNLSNSGTAILTKSGLNYNDIIETTSLDRQFTSSSDLTGQTIVMVAKASGAQSAGGLAGFDGNVGFRGADKIQHTTTGNGNDWAFPGTLRINGANQLTDYAGIDDWQIIVGDRGVPFTNPFFVGGYNPGSYYNDADFAEVIIYSDGRSDTEIQKIESYLAIKYSITLDDSAGGSAGDYVDSNGQVIWDASVAPGYHNNLIGVVRDDFGELDQRKSVSATAGLILDKGGAFPSDGSYILAGHNTSGPMTVTAYNSHPSYGYRLNRIWRTAVVGSPGPISIGIIIPGNSGVLADYALLVDAGYFFSTGATIVGASSISGDTISFTGINLANKDYFTLATNDFIGRPAGITTNVSLWLEAERGLNCTSNECGVTTWKDLSGRGNDLTNSGIATLAEDGLNTYNVIETTSLDRQFKSSSEITGQTVVMVARASDALSVGGLAGFNGDTGFRGTDAIQHTATGNNNDWTNPGTLRVNGVSQSGDYSGIDDWQIIVGDRGAVYTDTFFLGGYYAGRYYDNADFAEVIVYSDSKSNAELRKLESYLAIKYGITLDTSGGTVTYVISDGTRIWDNNFAYHNDIIGIGLDVDGNLHQRKSSNSSAQLVLPKVNMFSDGDFMMVGHDGNSMQMTTSGAYPGYTYKTQRIWKSQVTGSYQPVQLSIILPNNSGVLSDYALGIGSDEDFTSGTFTHSAKSINGDTITFSPMFFVEGDFFTLLSNFAAPFPGGVSTDLTVWLDPETGLNCTTGGCGITSWDDQSGNNQDLSNSGTATLSSAGLNYNNFISTSNVDRQFSTTGSLKGQTVVFVGGFPSSNFLGGLMGFDGDIGLRGTGGIDNPGSGGDWSNGGLLRVNGVNQSGNVSDIGDWQIISAVSSAPFSDKFYLGGYFSGRSLPQANYGEVIVYEGDVSPDIRKVESYLAIKYGLTLDDSAGGIAGDYLDSFGNTVWDASFESNYHNDIIGLARDDNSGLLQKQSHTDDDSVKIYLEDLAPSNSTNTAIKDDFLGDRTYIIVGHNGGQLNATSVSNLEAPGSITARLEREWKMTITIPSFTVHSSFKINMDIQLSQEAMDGGVDPFDLVLLESSYHDFSSANEVTADISYNAGVITLTDFFVTPGEWYYTIGSKGLGTPLPVTLTDFSATVNDQDQVALEWQTASELNNDHFEIERSKTGEEWEKLIELKGAGTSSEVNVYQYRDRKPLYGKSFYRLKQVDYDGTETIYEVKAVDLVFGESDVNIYPNPAIDEAVLQGKIIANSSITIRSISGKIYYATVVGESFNVRLDTHFLPEGIYMINISKPGVSAWKKLIISRP